MEDLPGPVNTNAALVGAAARCFLRLGAARVVIGEGPGHQRDTELVVLAAGLKPHLGERRIEFVDLNRDELRKVHLKGELQRAWHSPAAACRLVVRLRRVHAEGQDASLGGRLVESEK